MGFDESGHHTRDVTGLEVMVRGFVGGVRDIGDIRILGIVENNSLLLGLAVPRSVLGGSNAWAWLSRGRRLVDAIIGDGRIRRRRWRTGGRRGRRSRTAVRRASRS